MKILILGLDGLEYKLVKRWKLNVFKQKTFGIHDVSYFKNIFTPIIWASFLIGRNVEKEGFTVQYLHEKPLPPILRPLYRLRLKIMKRKLGVRKILSKLNIIPKEPMPCNLPLSLLKETFLEEAKEKGYSVYAVEVPGYNERTNEKWRVEHKNYIFRPLQDRINFAEAVFKEVQKRVNLGLRAIGRYDLVFIYLPIPDLLCHIFHPARGIKTKIRLYSYHKRLEKIIIPLLNLAYQNNYLTLIISDHGIKIDVNDHSEYGFWSLNIVTKWSPHKITDFKKKILEWLTNDTDYVTAQ